MPFNAISSLLYRASLHHISNAAAQMVGRDFRDRVEARAWNR